MRKVKIDDQSKPALKDELDEKELNKVTGGGHHGTSGQTTGVKSGTQPTGFSNQTLWGQYGLPPKETI